MYIESNIGNRIKERRNELKITQKELAARINGNVDLDNASHTQISQWEQGKKTPETDALIRLCNALECDMDYLLCAIDVPRRATYDVMQQTGLSADAVYFLQDVKNSHTFKSQEILKAINALLSEEKFCDCADYWERLALFLFSPDQPFKTLLLNGEREFTAENVLSILLSENEQFLRALRREGQKHG